MMVIVKVSDNTVYPAENLRWTSEFQNNQYTIHSVATAFSDVTVPTEVTTSGARNDLVLATISKTGRPMPITQEYTNP